MHYWCFYIALRATPSNSRECLKIESWGPGLHSFEASKHEFWVLCSMWPLKKHYWYFLIPPSGPASGSRGCWKMESGCPGIQSLGAFNINFVNFVQHTGPLKKTLLVFFDATPRPVSGSRRCRKMGSWGHGIHHCKAFNTDFWYFVQHLALTPTTGGIMQMAYNNFMMEIRK